MTLLQLRYFRAVCESGSTVRAAESLSVCQPTISMTIRALEEEYDVKLFVRQGKTLTLTKEGETLSKLAASLLKQYDYITDVMHDLANERSYIRLGITPMLASILLPRLCYEFSESSKTVHFVVTEGSQYQLFELLGKKEVDVVITSYDEAAKDVFDYIPMSSMEYGFVVSKNHPLSGLASVSAEDIRNESFVVFRDSNNEHTLNEFFTQHQYKPNILYRSDQLSTIAGLIERNSAAAILYMRVVPSQFPHLKCMPLNPSVHKDIGAFWRKDSYLGSDIQHFLDAINRLTHDLN